MYFWYVDGNNSDRLIWQTKDGGTSWTQINDDGITNCGDVLGGCGTEQGSYNLELAAVPNGQVTDLYAGAVNLYKCRITTAFAQLQRQRARHFHQSHARLWMSAEFRLDRARSSLPARHSLPADQRQHPGRDVLSPTMAESTAPWTATPDSSPAPAAAPTSSTVSTRPWARSPSSFPFRSIPLIPIRFWEARETTARPQPALHKAAPAGSTSMPATAATTRSIPTIPRNGLPPTPM